jgi:hypothetical protein
VLLTPLHVASARLLPKHDYIDQLTPATRWSQFAIDCNAVQIYGLNPFITKSVVSLPTRQFATTQQRIPLAAAGLSGDVEKGARPFTVSKIVELAHVNLVNDEGRRI